MFSYLPILAIVIAGLVPLTSTYYPELYKEVTVGIDLGTTYSVLAVCSGGQLKVINFDDDGVQKPLVPSYVHFTSDGDYIVGHAAKRLKTGSFENTVYDVKRIIGRNFSDVITQEEIQNLPYKVIDGSEDKPIIIVNENTPAEARYSPEMISSLVVGALKTRLEKYTGLRGMLGWKLGSATISVPANFDNEQKLATIEAGRLAGLRQVRLIAEPSAAALAYRLDKAAGTKNVLVFDFGGGTLDVALLVLAMDTFQVITTAGNAHLGGEDIDRAITKKLIQEFTSTSGVDISFDSTAKEILKRAAENLKVALSDQMEAGLELPEVSQGKGFKTTWSREDINEVLDEELKYIIDPITEVLATSMTEKSEIDNVVLVGGSSRIPRVREMITNYFPDVKMNYNLDPDQAIALGAALTRNCV